MTLINTHKSNIDWSLIEEYFVLFGLNDMFKELRRKYGDNQ